MKCKHGLTSKQSRQSSKQAGQQIYWQSFKSARKWKWASKQVIEASNQFVNETNKKVRENAIKWASNMEECDQASKWSSKRASKHVHIFKVTTYQHLYEYEYVNKQKQQVRLNFSSLSSTTPIWLALWSIQHLTQVHNFPHYGFIV